MVNISNLSSFLPSPLMTKTKQTAKPRPGHLIYCFGDFDSKYCRGLSGSAGSDYIMKQIWLEFNG